MMSNYPCHLQCQLIYFPKYDANLFSSGYTRQNLGLKFKNTGACMDALQLSHQLSSFLPSLFPKKKQYIEDIYFFEVNTI